MPKLSLRQAATAASVSKSTILRAIQTGRLSATRLETGGYDIDPAELFRVYPAPMRTAEMGQDAPSETAGATHATPVAHELQIRMAQLGVAVLPLTTAATRSPFLTLRSLWKLTVTVFAPLLFRVFSSC